MSGFRRSFLGYRRSEVDAEIAARDAAIAATERTLATCRAKVEELEGVARRLSETVVERNRELRALREELAELRHGDEEGIRAIVAVGRQLEELRTAARGQATQIRLRALRHAAELVDRAREGAVEPQRAGNARSNGLFKGTVHVDVGPLSDFSQLVALEDAAGSIDATSEISIKRFSRGRATLAMELSEPVELLQELEERCDLEFRVRSLRDDSVILDVDEEE
jgi:chromosome segregation ATPase